MLALKHIVPHRAWFVPVGGTVGLLAAALAGQQGTGFREAPLLVPTSARTGFTVLSSADTGLLWTNRISHEQVARHYNMVGGGGVAAGDFDRDGRCDLYFCNRGGENALFRNLGQGRFQNVTAAAGVGCPGQSSTGACFADVNGDGRPDLLVSSFWGPNACFVNLGDGRFTNVTQTAGLSPRGGATSLALGDLDGDGDLDLYAGYFGIESVLREGGRVAFQMVNGRPVVTGRHSRRLRISEGQLIELGEQDVLYRNDGQGHFAPANWTELFSDEEVSRAAGAPMDFGLSVQVRDLNEDGAPDIYVCNDFQTPDRAWLNDGQGRFRAPPPLALRNMSYASMGVDFADIDRDGRLDFITVEMLSRDHAHRLRQLSSMPLAARRVGAGEDREAVPRKLLSLYPLLDNRNAAFRNRGDLTFEDVSQAWGFDSRRIAQGMALADLDGDGDLDVVMNCANAPPLVCRNDSAAPRVAVRLNGLPPNTPGIGAKVRLFGGAVPMQSQEIIAGGRYLSGDEPMRVFAAGGGNRPMRIEVTWRTGRWSEVNGAKANCLYEIEERVATERPALEPEIETSGPTPWFEDVSGLLDHTHHEEEFDDFVRQPLLPKKLSQLGPGVAWQDVDEDGWDDLIVGSGKGGRLAVQRNDGNGGFQRLRGRPWEAPVARDQTGIVGVGRRILVGSGNYEDGLLAGDCVHEYAVAAEELPRPFPGQPSSTGPLALADMDGDGALELFVGGRVTSGRYPEPATSLLFRQRHGRWELDVANTRQLAQVGLVSGAVWSDLDGDGFPELILACEWGPVRIFGNDAGRLDERRVPLRGALAATLDELTGWWDGVTTGDFDGDGRLDIVASNWGLNSRYRASRERPCKVYFGDLAGQGRVDLVEAADDEARRAERPERDLSAVELVLPWVRDKFGTHAAYARASVHDIYGERLRAMSELRATTLATMVLLNRDGQFVAVPLCAEAQFSPAFATCVADADGDGDEDVFLSQNFFATQPETSRLDAGRGLWLAGDGRGQFQPVPGQRSGVRVDGEQRGAALGDYDQDGRTDLVVTQNGAATKLYRNVGARPGLRVRLRGPAGNRWGVGTQLRLGYGAAMGPAREIHTGSGYWSQDSAVQVISAPEPPTTLWARWPGGRITTADLPPRAREVELDESGVLKLVR